MCLFTIYVAYRVLYPELLIHQSNSLTRPCVCHDSVCQDKLPHREQETKQYLCSFLFNCLFFNVKNADMKIKLTMRNKRYIHIHVHVLLFRIRCGSKIYESEVIQCTL